MGHQPQRICSSYGLVSDVLIVMQSQERTNLGADIRNNDFG